MSQVKFTSVEDLKVELVNANYQNLPASMTLTAQEIYMIQQAGYEPMQIVFGSIVYSMGIRGFIKSFGKALRRGEMSEFTEMNQEAREIARNRMLEKAKEIGATHVMDVKFEEHEWSDFLEIVATGTACKKVSDQKDMHIAIGS